MLNYIQYAHFYPLNEGKRIIINNTLHFRSKISASFIAIHLSLWFRLTFPMEVKGH